MKYRIPLLLLLLVAENGWAVEVCGVDPNLGTFKSGFEPSEIRPIPEAVLPLPGTPLAVAVQGPASGSIVDAASVQIY